MDIKIIVSGRQPSPAAPYADGWCQTCGNPVTREHRCCCWCHVADTLQRFLGMDFDASADKAARMWDAIPDADNERVWTAAYADDHQVDAYAPPPELAALCEQDAINHPDDDPCPQCGRRQHDDEANPATCQACGWTLAVARHPIGAGDSA